MNEFILYFAHLIVPLLREGTHVRSCKKKNFVFPFVFRSLNRIFVAENTITMKVIQIKDKKFAISIPESEILKRVDAVAQRINHDLEGKNPLFLPVLNGSFMFAADLMKRITIPCEISFVKLASYQGTTSTGKVTEVIGINEDLSGRTVVIVEDIVESGLTMKRMIETLVPRRQCRSVRYSRNRRSWKWNST